MSLRFIVVHSSLAIVLAVLTVFASGPLWGLVLDYPRGQQIQLIQLVLPTFLSYLSSAVTYATVGAEFSEPEGERGKLLRTVCIGGLIIFVVAFFVSTLVYYLSANGTLQAGRLDFARYTNIITLLLSVLAVTTSAVTAVIFAAKKKN